MRSAEQPRAAFPRAGALVSASLLVTWSLPIALSGCARKASPEPGPSAISAAAAPTVEVAVARLGTIERALPVTGTLAAPRDRQAIVSPTVSGVLDALSVHAGDTVTRGQIVAHISTRPVVGQIEQAQATIAQSRIQVQQAEANQLQQQAMTQTGIAQARSSLAQANAALLGAEASLEGNRAAVRNARQALERAQSLEREGLVARKDVEAAQLAVQTAEAQMEAQRQAVDAQRQAVDSQSAALDAARAAAIQNIVKSRDVAIARQQVRNASGALATARSQIAQYTLRAPLSGIVTSVGASIGETVDTTTKIAAISNLATLQLQISIPADSVRDVHPGQQISFTVDELQPRSFTTTIRTVSDQIDPASNTIQAIAAVANPRNALSNGAFVRARIVLERRTRACLVPKSALLRDETGQTAVDMIGEDDTLHVTPVRTGLADATNVEIVSGVGAGNRVATVGAYGLPDGTKVTVAAGAAR